MKTYFISSTATVSCYTSVEANSKEEAFFEAWKLPDSAWEYMTDGAPDTEAMMVYDVK